MIDLFEYAFHNTAFAVVLAIVEYAFTRWMRNPPVAHLLWVLVLLKLVTPPLYHFELPETQLTALVSQNSNSPTVLPLSDSSATSPLSTQTSVLDPNASDNSQLETISIQSLLSRAAILFGWIWIIGTVCFSLVAASRIFRFERLLQGTLPASSRHQLLADNIASKIGLRRVPQVRYVECANIPLAWCVFRRPLVVLPVKLVRQFDDQQLAMVLAHELAHLRRRDHLVRALELLVAAIYWWNPLVWIVRHQIHQAEDLCCDAWVRSEYPDSIQSYANVLVETATSLGTSRIVVPPFAASTFLRSHSLKARIEMILKSKFAPQASMTSLLFVALLGMIVLPLFFSSAATAVAEEANAKQVDQALPYVVQFEQGATKFEEGDDISILEIRGTAKEFVPGHIYWIKGTYKLNSQDSAMLAAYTTARHAKDGKSTPLKVQSINIKKGEGTFTLILPMKYEGWPHISFYNGQGFGGNYFGTGESVLKKWWN